MDNLKDAVRKSTILTTHNLSTHRSTHSLPSLHSSVQYLPNPKKQTRFMVIDSKNRHQIQHEERVKGLMKLKTSLSTQRLSLPLPSIKKSKEIPKEKDFVENIESQLNKMMGISEEQNSDNPEDEIDPDKIQFVELCKQILEVYTFATQQKNMRFKNKILQMIEIMKKKDLLSPLVSVLSNNNPNISQLYRKYKKQFNREESIFKRQLKMLASQASFMIDFHQKNKYRYLNEGIDRIKEQMSKEGLKIGEKLSNIDNFSIRNGIFKSLKKMDFDCLANRNYYSQHTERMAKFNPNDY